MTDRVWLVSSGHYSEYLVHCAAPSREAAENIVIALNAPLARTKYFVEEVPVIDKARQFTIYGLEVVISDDGIVTAEAVYDREEWNVNPLHPERLQPVTVRWVRAPVYKDQAGRLEVYGLDQGLVRKTFSDMKARLVADPELRESREFKLGFTR